MNSHRFFTFLPITLSAILTLCVSCASGPSSKSTQEELPFAGKYKVHRFKLENDLRLLVVEDHSSPTFAYQTWFKVGSRNEKMGRTGLAHLFEHMMFKETKTLKDGEFDRLLEAAGVQGENAFTGRDYTAYIQELPVTSLDLVARLESDRMVNLIINEKAFKTETEVVQNERRYRNENSPEGQMDQQIYELAFKDHPYHWPIIGYEKDLAEMSASYAEDFYRTYYSPNHATIVVVGDVDPNAVYKTVQKYYKQIPAQPSPQLTITPEPTQKSPRRKKLALNIQVEKLMLGVRVPGFTHTDQAALQLLQSVLTGGKSSRLHLALVDTGIATAVEAYGLESKDPGLLVFAVNLQQKKHATQAESVILKEFKNLIAKPISALELDRAKNRIQFEFYQGLSSNYTKAIFLGQYETIGSSFEDGIRNFEKIQSLSSQDIQRVAKRYLDPQARTVITGVPK